MIVFPLTTFPKQKLFKEPPQAYKRSLDSSKYPHMNEWKRWTESTASVLWEIALQKHVPPPRFQGWQLQMMNCHEKLWISRPKPFPWTKVLEEFSLESQ